MGAQSAEERVFLYGHDPWRLYVGGLVKEPSFFSERQASLQMGHNLEGPKLFVFLF